MSDQGAPADHPECRERVPCTRREKLEIGLALRTRERMMLCQLVLYKSIGRKETLDKHVRVIEGQNICFIEIIKVQEGYISLFMRSTGRNA
jgi:hypothetical protein